MVLWFPNLCHMHEPSPSSLVTQRARIADFILLERKLIQTMRDSIQVQQDGGTESEVT